MRGVILVAAVVALAGPGAAQTADAAAATATTSSSAPAAVKVGAVVRASDGRRIGRIDRLETRGGQEVASLIYQSRIVHIPVSTLSVGTKGLVTSLARADIK